MINTEVGMSEDPRQPEGPPAEPGRPEDHAARQRRGLLALSVLTALFFAGALAYAVGGGLLSVGGEDIGQRERRDLPREWTNMIPLRPVGPELVEGLGRGRDASEVAGSSDQSEERGQRGRDAGPDRSPTTARLGAIRGPGALATRLPRPRVVTVIGPLAPPRLPGLVELVRSLPQLPGVGITPRIDPPRVGGVDIPPVDPFPGGVDIPPGGLFPGGLFPGGLFPGGLFPGGLFPGGLPLPPTGLPIPGGLPLPPTGLPIPGAGGVTALVSVPRGAVEAPQLLGMDAALRELDARARESGSESPAGDGKAKARRSGRDRRRRSDGQSRRRREVTRMKDVALDRPDPASRGSGHRAPEAPPKQEDDSPQPAPADRRRSSHTPDSEACRA
ncbi:MAG: hypothetical protein H0T96_08675, partial [Thermoleophilaceae bacterium]|nr:hypothetical protein [Thermoleophilaceae bacterium]